MNEFYQGVTVTLGIMFIPCIAVIVLALVSRWQSSARYSRKQGEMLNLEPLQETSEKSSPMAVRDTKMAFRGTEKEEQEKVEHGLCAHCANFNDCGWGPTNDIEFCDNYFMANKL